MSTNTGIEWTDATWNPIAGCSRVSEGCRHCYAERFAHRFSGPGQRYDGLTVLKNGHPTWTGKIQFSEKALLEPLKWKRPRRVFVNSMSDLFHDNVITEWIVRIFAVMALTPRHTYQVLTKRASNMNRLLTDVNFLNRLSDRIEEMRTDEPRRAVGPLPHLEPGERWFPLANVWLGVSVEHQAAADERIPLLLQTPAAVRFLSCEPLLGPVNLCAVPDDKTRPAEFCARYSPCGDLDWVICGGESGPGARPIHPDWARSLRDQCQSAGVPFFMKQMGSVFGPNKGHDLPPDLNIKQYPERTA